MFFIENKIVINFTNETENKTSQWNKSYLNAIYTTCVSNKSESLFWYSALLDYIEIPVSNDHGFK